MAKRQRLHSTRNIFNNKNQTTLNIVKKIDRQVTDDYRKLNAIRGPLLRATRQSTLDKLSVKLTALAQEMGHQPPKTTDKQKMLRKIGTYKKQNSFLRYGAINQATINLCATYEDFIHRVVMKYYEEDARRLISPKQSLTNSLIVKAMMRGDNMHHTLAQKVADDLMYGSVGEWHRVLNKVIGMDTTRVPAGVQEVFFIRHCLVHNNNKVSSQLHEFSTTKYPLRSSIPINVSDLEQFRDELHNSVDFIISEYTRLFPTDGGSWLKTYP